MLKRVSWTLAGIGWLGSVQAVTLVVDNEDADHGLSQQQPLVFRLEGLELAPESLRFFLGSVDITTLLQHQPDGGYRLPAGSHEFSGGNEALRVYRVDADGWETVAETEVVLLTAGGQQQQLFDSSIELSLDAASDGSSDGDFDERQRSQEAVLNGRLEGSQRRNALQLRASASVFGSTEREQALQYYQRGAAADKLDLAEYLVEAEYGDTTVAVGHVSQGQHPLLVDNVSNRGVKVTHQLGKGLDIALASQNGSSIVGFSNLIGLRSFEHNITTASLGYDWLNSRPGSLRTELSYLAGQIRSDSDFDVGEVPINEKSEGWGIRLHGSSPEGRVSGAVNYARATYDNPADPELQQRQAVVKTSTDAARSAHLRVEAVDALDAEGLPAALAIEYRFEQTDPLYKTLAAYPNADTEQQAVLLDGQIGEALINAEWSSFHDNLDRIPTILKTRTRNQRASVILPQSLCQSLWFSGETDACPETVLTLNRSHQKAANTPDPELSGFADPSQLPDQVAQEFQLGFDWPVSFGSVGYQLSLSELDNRQSGRELADIEQLSHEIRSDFSPSDWLDMGVGLGRSRTTSREDELVSYSDFVSVDANLALPRDWALALSTEFALDSDAQDLSENDSRSAQLRLSKRIRFRLPNGLRRSAQGYLRYSHNELDVIDRAFDYRNRNQNWSAGAGLSLNLF